MNERVSVLIRSSNRPELAEALAALVAQTHAHLEVVIVNVTGRPHAPLPDAASALTVRFVDPGHQLPRPDAANAAIDAASGDYLVILDDDDLLEPEHCERALAVARAHPDAIPFAGASVVDAKGELQMIWPAMGFGRIELAEKIRMSINAPLVPRKFVGADVRFDVDLPIFEDWDFWLQLQQRAPFQPVPFITAIFRPSVGTSGTGMGANFDLDRTGKQSHPFHAKWSALRSTLQQQYNAHVAEATAAAEARDWARAERACWEAQALRIWDPPILSLLAKVHAHRAAAGRPQEKARAEKLAAAAERARWLNPPHLTHATLLRLEAHLRKGNAYALADEAELAEREFLGALALHEGDQTACNGLANLRIAQGRLEDAEEFLRRGTSWGDKIWPPLLLKRGGVLEKLGRRAEARQIYRYLTMLVPRNETIRGRLQALEAIAAAA
jgi:hypothetical protein